MDLHLLNTANSEFVKDLKALASCTAGEKRNVSKSYTQGAVALCVSDMTTKVGIDLEKKKKRSPEAMEHFVKKFSTFQIKDIPSKLEEQWFYKAWTGMESYFKLDGAGFGTPKDFILDLKRQSVWRKGREVARLEYFDIGNFLICLCSSTMFSKQDVQVIYHGWENDDEEVCARFFGTRV